MILDGHGQPAGWTRSPGSWSCPQQLTWYHFLSVLPGTRQCLALASTSSLEKHTWHSLWPLRPQLPTGSWFSQQCYTRNKTDYISSAKWHAATWKMKGTCACRLGQTSLRVSPWCRESEPHMAFFHYSEILFNF